MTEKKKDLLDEMAQVVKIEINNQQHELKRYTVRTEIELRKEFQDMEEWTKKFQSMDAETLCKTLYILLKEPAWESWQDLADELPADTLAKAQIAAAISSCVATGMPEVREAIDDAVKKFRSEIRKNMKSKNK